MFQRSAGVLMNLSSLPSPFGIGDFGHGGYQFVDLLCEMRMRWWQILPLCPIGKGNSPYSSVSAFALNLLYLDPYGLLKDGYLSQAEVDAAVYSGSPHQADYKWAACVKAALMSKAYEKADVRCAELKAFREEQAFWLIDYARFMAARDANGGKPWRAWTKNGAQEAIDYYIFEQFILFQQWNRLKAYANAHGISILGDMPIYVSDESADFWANRTLFETTPEGEPKSIAGVPPDYFSEDGQLWGNPLYDWVRMKQDGYRWWLQRIGNSLKIYDAVRIDHFRGFYRYWAVPADAKTARVGTWEPGPGMELFHAVNAAFSNPQIVAEDLGCEEEGLVQFLLEAGYPGMKVMQFAYYGWDSIHLPYKYTENYVAYTGTHDNDTMLGWLWSAKPEERSQLLAYCRFTGDWGSGGPQSPVLRAIFETLWQTPARMTILPVQDLCGYGTDTRMNLPGEAEGNWCFRMTEEALRQIDTAYFRQLNERYGRA